MYKKINNTSQQNQSLDKNWCLITFKYTKLLQFKITPTFWNSNRNIATFIKAKEVFIYKSVFSKPFINYNQQIFIIAGIMYLKIMEKKIFYTLVSQYTIKTLGFKKINC